MNYKVKGALKKSKKSFIVSAIIVIVIALFVVSPIAYSQKMAEAEGQFNIKIFIDTFIASVGDPFGTFGRVFESGAFGIFFGDFLIMLIIYSICFFIGFRKAFPKNEFVDIEHGSSDWSQKGEQYSMLNKDKGIILAENNYLPVNKIGNVNVLVVGRFWFW